MKDEEFGKQFWQRADQFINLANEQSQASSSGEVSSSFLYAAARFNAFIAAATARNIDELKKNKEEAINYFSNLYREAFVENLEDWIANYDKHLSNNGTSGK
ncbi:MAG: DUF3144 domain-containing protein [Desulfobulbaceae bacterium]|nr:DUF3144 domain-containing protein [Desulfobulbaceae bacterium]